ncbi:MAG: hypothetical protein K1X64_11810 [Myxococcaceae bacterium]|nr:hypothetical protein [Myxococcaceae bacterium]
MPPLSRTVRRQSRRALTRGQAMVEYSIINWLLIVGLVLASTVRVIPGPQVGISESGRLPNTNLIEVFLSAYQNYCDSYYYILSLPFP